MGWKDIVLIFYPYQNGTHKSIFSNYIITYPMSFFFGVPNNINGNLYETNNFIKGT